MDVVKNWRKAMTAFGSCGLLLVSGCPFHDVGLVRPVDDTTTLEDIDGFTYRLILTDADAAPLHYLDGHTADVWGTRLFHNVHVTDWKVIEGLHGMPAWVGTLEEKGVQLAILDRNSKAWYVLDRDATESLEPYVGKVVLVEGYVDGAQRVRVVYFRVLAEP
jgi:hypothetical protein